MGKIIAVIEDTGERRLPVEGETYTHLSCLRDGDITNHLFTHTQTGGEYVILCCTESADGSIGNTLTILERVELINLRRFRESVSEAQNRFAAVRTEEPEKIRDEMTRLAARLQLAGNEIRELLEYRLPSPADEAAFEKVIADAFKASIPVPRLPHQIVDAEWPEVEEELPL